MGLSGIGDMQLIHGHVLVGGQRWLVGVRACQGYELLQLMQGCAGDVLNLGPDW